MTLGFLAFTYVSLSDGTITVGNLASADDGKGKPRKAGSDRDVTDIMNAALDKIPRVGTEGVTEVMAEDVNQWAKTAGTPQWMERWKSSVIATTKTFKGMRDYLDEHLPKDNDDTGKVHATYDNVVRVLGKWETKQLADALVIDVHSLDAFNITEDMVATDYETRSQDKDRLHETITGLIRQYIYGSRVSTTSQINLDIAKERSARASLLLYMPNAEDGETGAMFDDDMERSTQLRDGSLAAKVKAERLLEALTQEVGLPTGTFFKDPGYWLDLGDYASSFTSWRKAVGKLVKDESLSKDDIIKGWPRAEEWRRSKCTGSTERESKKKRKKRKKKQGKGKAKAEGSDHETEPTATEITDTADPTVSEASVVETSVAEDEQAEYSEEIVPDAVDREVYDYMVAFTNQCNQDTSRPSVTLSQVIRQIGGWETAASMLPRRE